STDAGLTWSALDLPGSVSSRQLHSVYFTDAMNGTVVGGWPYNDSIRTVIRTADGGENWTIIMDSPGSMLHDVHFYDVSNGYAVGDLGLVMVTEDGGLTWAELELPDNNNLGLRSVFFAGPYYGICTGEDGKIFRYIDESVEQASGFIQTPITLIDSNSVFIEGQVNDFDLPTTIEFEYGTSTDFGNAVDMDPNSTSGEGTVDVDLLLTGLESDEIYFGRMMMTNELGTSYSEIVSFYTGFSTVPNFNFEDWELFESEVLEGWQNDGIISPVASYNGSLAARLQGVDDNVGALLLASPGDEGLSGGIPFSERPDTLSFWVNYDVVEGDSALIYLQLRDNGMVVSQNIFKYSGSSNGDFVNLKFPLDYINENFPDTLTMAFASSNVFSGVVFAESFVEIDDVTFSGVSTMLPNYNMEDWSLTTRYKADSWISVDDENGSGAPFAVERTDDAASGVHALLLKNRVHDNFTEFASIRTGIEIWGWNPAFSVNHNHEFLYGYLKFFPDNNDTLSVYISMFENGQMTGGGQYKFADEISDYQLFSVPLTYQMGTADSALIEFSIYKASGSAGASYAIIDNLSFDVVLEPVSVDDQMLPLEEALTILAYPNPAEDHVTLQFNRATNEVAEITIVDLSGNVIS